MPKKLLTSLAVFGKEASCIAFTFSGSGDIPFAENTAKKVRDSLLSSHFSGFNVKPTFANLQSTVCSAWS